MLLYIKDKSDSLLPFCLQTVMKKQGTWQVQQVSLQYFWFLFVWQDIVKICSSVTWSCMILWFVFYFWPSIKSWILSLLLLTLFANSSFTLVQLGLIFSFVPSFWSESTWPSLSKRQNCQLGLFCDICEPWRLCLHFCKARKFAG